MSFPGSNQTSQGGLVFRDRHEPGDGASSISDLQRLTAADPRQYLTGVLIQLANPDALHTYQGTVFPIAGRFIRN
ncbi:hypothetical protein Kisp01_69100 [Kineosporia sp. NBRC 101677]|nr:hypothetical protein Kisp01_69100 [Kineosporia sp. NBRC 101677]